jgi:hypothetical protein
MIIKRIIGFIALIMLFGLVLRLPYFFHAIQDIDEGDENCRLEKKIGGTDIYRCQAGASKAD